MKTILVTGVTGFIGRHVARLFNDLGWSVVGLGTSTPENAPLSSLNQYHKLVLPSPKLEDLVKEVSPLVCIHCAGRASVPLSLNQPYADFNANVGSTFNLLNALRLSAPKCRLVYLSSAAVYGNPQNLPITETHILAPISPYGFHKSICEQLCKEYYEIYGLPTVSTRIFSAYGPGIRRQVVWDICNKILTQPIASLQGTGLESRDFIHVQDIARAIYLLVENAPFEAETYNISSGQETTIKSLAYLIASNLNKAPNCIEFDGNIPAGNPANWRGDNSCLMKLGFTPKISLEQGISVYSQWCRAEIVGW
ncbi:MAG: NAD(P)-dependent oxidoreductase [Thermosynechococcaceae cyanobacterium MS004]|nr:NAD(P)-dependent oxidoreductase [Thermosynechococcaceae cyanobacterium MS004]